MKDIYFTKEYGVLYEKLEDGKCIEFTTEREYGVIRYIFIKREIPIKIEGETYCDITTPYGYGGPIIESVIDEYRETLIEDFQVEFKKYCNENKIVSEFVRFHPLEKNYKSFDKLLEIEKKSHTVAINLENMETIYTNLDKKCRKNLRKAEKEKLDLKIYLKEGFSTFYKLYIETMKKNSAGDYYYFNEEYFDTLFKSLGENIRIFTLYESNKPIASSIILLGGKYLHAHLGGNSKRAYEIGGRTYLYLKIAKWGMERGYKYLHLGGGYGGDESDIYRFKKGFNKNEDFEFHIGKKIRDKEIYSKLCIKNKNKNKYFPEYR